MRGASWSGTADAAAPVGADADRRAIRNLTLLVLAGLSCTLFIVSFLVLAALQAVSTIDGLATDRERTQVSRAVAAAPGGVNEVTLDAMAATLDLDHARLTTRDAVAPGELAVPAAPSGDRVVAWTPHRFGTQTFALIAPMRIGAGVTFALVAAFIGWRVWTVGHRLDRRRAAATQLALTDPLTGLGNRLAFDEALRSRCDAAETGGQGFVLVAVDLDGFKSINDTLGHAAGDIVLQAVASRLQASAGAGDLVARIGGDEFAIIRSADNLDAFAADILHRIAAPVRHDGRELRVAASLGLARSEDFPASAVRLAQAADSALYRAKRNGRGTAELAVPALPSRYAA